MKRSLIQLSDTQWLLIFGALIAGVRVALNGQYGFHRDELDIIINARRLDWGYVSYPPLTPLLARLELVLLGPSLRGMRLLPALSQGAAVVLAALIARDLGARRPGQTMAALAMAIGPAALTAGTLIQYMSFDYQW